VKRLRMGEPGYITFDARERHRRGPRTAGCLVSPRFLRFGRSWDGPQGRRYVDVDILTDVYDDESGKLMKTKKLCGLVLPVEDLHSILDPLDEDEAGLVE
jgi:hypothetical protein